MRSYEDALKLLLALSREMVKLNGTRKEYLNSGLNAADKAEKVDKLDDQLAQVEKERIDVLRALVLFPPHHLQYRQVGAPQKLRAVALVTSDSAGRQWRGICPVVQNRRQVSSARPA